jgi:hypothetical protein
MVLFTQGIMMRVAMVVPLECVVAQWLRMIILLTQAPRVKERIQEIIQSVVKTAELLIMQALNSPGKITS